MTFFLTWWLVTTFLGLCALPVTFFTLRHLPDRGFAAARVVGLVLASYVAWLVAHVAEGGIPLVAGVGALLAVSVFFGRGLLRQQLSFLRAQGRSLLAAEAIFALALLAGVDYEQRLGAIFETEKQADFTVLQGVMSSPRMPPHDPWLSGAQVSYYYFGYFMLAFLAKMTQTPPGVAHNMGLALVFALTALMAFSLGRALTGRARYGMLLAYALTLMGNLDYWYRAIHVYQYGDLQEEFLVDVADNPAMKDGFAGVLEYLRDPVSHNWEHFQAARLIMLKKGEHLITEYPAWSFFLGDVHPHLISLPFLLLTLCLSLNLLLAPLSAWGAFGARRSWQIGQAVVTAVLFGSLGFINAWDLPTALVVLGACLLLREIWILKQASWSFVTRAASVGLPLAALAILAYAPFYRTLVTQARGIGLVTHRTDIWYWPFMIGPFLLVLVPALVLRARGAGGEEVPPPRAPAPASARAKRKGEPGPKASRAAQARCVLCGSSGSEAAALCPKCGGEIVPPVRSASWPAGRLSSAVRAVGSFLSGSRRPWGVILAAAAVVIAAVDVASPAANPAVTIFCLLLAGLAVAGLAVRGDSREMAFAGVVAAIAFGEMLACEWIYLKDLFEQYPHLVRLNTVFKFYVHAWVLLSVAAAGLLAWLLRAPWPRWPAAARRAFAGLAAFLMIGTIAFPIVAWHFRMGQYQWPVDMLDGTEFLRLPGVLPDDARAIDWLKENARWEDGRPPVILESWGMSFTLHGRFATFTGFSTVIGWEGHEEQWRGGQQRPIRGGIDDQDTCQRRYEDSSLLYESTDLDVTKRLLARYRVRYVVVGRLEREKHPNADFAKWDRLARRVFESGALILYEVPR